MKAILRAQCQLILLASAETVQTSYPFDFPLTLCSEKVMFVCSTCTLAAAQARFRSSSEVHYSMHEFQLIMTQGVAGRHGLPNANRVY